MSDYNPRALQKDAVVRALKTAGSRTITEATLEADIESGAPVNENGTINLFSYGAWLIREENRRVS